MAVRTSKLAAVIFPSSGAGGTQNTIFTVPAGQRWLVKQYSVFNGGNASVTFTTWLRTAGTLYAVRRLVIAAGGVEVVGPSFSVFHAGDAFVITTATANVPLTVTAFGAALVV